MRVRIPATSANLGPGFDCLGLALSLYNYVTIEVEKPFSIEISGKYTSGLPCDESNLIWRTMCYLWDQIGFPYPNIKLSFENNIPPARGLGSSSAAIVGGLVAANHLAGQPLSKLDLVQIANELEGHPDNITPALLGGLTLSVMTDDKVIAKVIDPKPNLRAVVAIPNYFVKTEEARKVLPSHISRQDAIFNISHCGLILDAIFKREYNLLKVGMQDRIHQTQRAGLIPGMLEALDAALNAGAYGSALSGSGPTILALSSRENEADVARSLCNVFTGYKLEATTFILDIDSVGAILEK